MYHIYLLVRTVSYSDSNGRCRMLCLLGSSWVIAGSANFIGGNFTIITYYYIINQAKKEAITNLSFNQQESIINPCTFSGAKIGKIVVQ